MKLTEISPTTSHIPTAAQIGSGLPVVPILLLQIMSATEWEQFTEEWLTHFKLDHKYVHVRRAGGAGDLGLDIVAFTSQSGFDAPWDSYQCKHYGHALYPSDVYGEVAKLIYHSFNKTPPFNQTYVLPRRHVFVAPRGVGITLGRLLNDPARFREEIRNHWDKDCAPALGHGTVAPLSGAFLAYFDSFDYSIFGDVSAAELIEGHAKTVFYAPRFGGGLPPRQRPEQPPSYPTASESVYIRKVLDAYADYLEKPVHALNDLAGHPDLHQHYDRQRVLFYSAEALRNFARDRTPPMTFESLQDDIFHGVIDTCESPYVSALERLRATITAAGQLNVGGNALVSVTNVADKQGVCHQLANDDRLTWKKD